MDQPTKRPAGNRTATAAAATQRKQRVGPKQYLTEVQGEMKKVVWPTRPEVQNSTLIVLVAILVMGSLIFAFDWSSVHIVDFIFG